MKIIEMIKKVKAYLLKKWWILLVAFFLFSIIFLNISFSTNKVLVNSIGFLYLISALLLLISGSYHLYIKKWFIAITQLASLIIGFITLIFFIVFLALYAPTDTFANNLELPKIVNLEYPINLGYNQNLRAHKSDSIFSLNKNNISFQLYNSFQPGLFEYDLWLKTDKSGYVYIKAFEITKETELSSSELMYSTRLEIPNTKGKFKKFGTVNDFTIYEGDWEKPYGTRFEIWFISTNGEKNIKLLEKNYVIEGWMR